MLAIGAAASNVALAEARTPGQTVDLFHEALRTRNVSLALSLLSRKLTVFESGRADRSRSHYAAAHLPVDMRAAAESELVTRLDGGMDDQRWVLSTYRLAPRPGSGAASAMMEAETALLRRVGGDWRIEHIHWSISVESD